MVFILDLLAEIFMPLLQNLKSKGTYYALLFFILAFVGMAYCGLSFEWLIVPLFFISFLIILITKRKMG